MTKNKNKIPQQTRDGILIKYDQMQRIASDLGTTVDRLVGGYMRQPIYALDNQDGTYTITAGCALSGKYNCHKKTPVTDERSACYGCSVYLAYFPEKK